MDDVFDEIDRDGNGRISFEEFDQFLCGLKDGPKFSRNEREVLFGFIGIYLEEFFPHSQTITNLAESVGESLLMLSLLLTFLRIDGRMRY